MSYRVRYTLFTHYIYVLYTVYMLLRLICFDIIHAVYHLQYDRCRPSHGEAAPERMDGTLGRIRVIVWASTPAPGETQELFDEFLAQGNRIS